jgi:hypothetical protein
LSRIIADRKPKIGKRAAATATPFGAWGVAVGDKVATGNIRYSVPDFDSELGQICCPRFSRGSMARSVRYYARGGPTMPHVRKQAVAHCLGTNIGAAPTFAIPLKEIRSKLDRDSVLEFSNWSREQVGHLIFRLKPERALRLFGAGAERLEAALRNTPSGVTEKYIWLGNMVAPVVAKRVAESIRALALSMAKG